VTSLANVVDLSLALIVCIVKIYASILKFASAHAKHTKKFYFSLLFLRPSEIVCKKKEFSRFFTVHLQTIVADYVV
jgi:hypothetical protein